MASAVNFSVAQNNTVKFVRFRRNWADGYFFSSAYSRIIGKMFIMSANLKSNRYEIYLSAQLTTRIPHPPRMLMRFESKSG
jgi:hypothetical protein